MSTDHYSALKFSERLCFETSIRHWQTVANPNLSKDEIESIINEIRKELCACSSVEDVLETMEKLKEEAKQYDVKATTNSLGNDLVSRHESFDRASSSKGPAANLDLLDSPLLANVGCGESPSVRIEIRDQLILLARPLHFNAGDHVVEAGTTACSMFFVTQGSLAVLVNGVRQRTISQGECFGEVALVRFFLGDTFPTR